MNKKLISSMKRISLARLPTPITKLNRVSREVGKDIFIWRDDLTGFTESGNKIRKLEFLLAEALEQGCDSIVTCGAPQSNHTRATVVAARQLGIPVSIVCAIPKTGLTPSEPYNGNLLLNQIFGAHFVWVSADSYQLAGSYEPFLLQESERLKSTGKKPYVIPLGGSNAVGAMGYCHAVQEMKSTWSKIHPGSPTDLFCALGSAGTYVGLQLGLKRDALPTRLWGVNIQGEAGAMDGYIRKVTTEVEEKYEARDLSEQSTVVEGHAGKGYALVTDEELGTYLSLAREEGILLDPVYTGKAFRAMIQEIKKDRSRFGDAILFLHSGGGFANFAFADQYSKLIREKSI